MQDYHFNEHFDRFPVAMAYVPWQNWENLYNECDAFERGTAFPSLDLPFTGKGGILR